MAIPASPTDGLRASIGGVLFEYDLATTSWKNVGGPTNAGATATDMKALLGGIPLVPAGDADLVSAAKRIDEQSMRQLDYLSSSGTLTPDHATYRAFNITLSGPLTIAAPSAVRAGQTILFVLNQDATGGRVVTWNAAYRFQNGTPPALSGANKVDLITGYVVSTTKVIMAASVSNA